MFDDLDDGQFDQLLHRSLHARPRLTPIADLVERAIAKGTLSGSTFNSRIATLDRLRRQRRLHHITTLAALTVVAIIVYVGWQSLPDASLGLWSSYDTSQTSGGSAALTSQGNIGFAALMIGGGLLLIRFVFSVIDYRPGWQFYIPQPRVPVNRVESAAQERSPGATLGS